MSSGKRAISYRSLITRTERVKIESDGIYIKVEQISFNEREIMDGNTFYASINIRDTHKIIPYLLIDKIETSTEYKISNLRDSFLKDTVDYSNPFLSNDNDVIKITTIKLKFSGLNEKGKMIWEGNLL